MAEFPMTREEVMAFREVKGFVTPLEPVEPGNMWFIWESRGSYEFMVHPTDAAWYLEYGITIDGQHLPVAKLDEWPMIGAWHLHAVDPDANKAFTPSTRVSDRELAISA